MRLPTVLRLGLLFLVSSPLAARSAPLTVTQSGYLLGSNDLPLNGSVSLTFRLYDVAGTQLWTSAACSVAVTSGYYATTLGDTCNGTPPLDSADLPAGQRRWVELSVDGVTLSPRQELTAAPTAQNASTSLDAQALRSDLSAPGTVNDTTNPNPVDWTKLKNVPSSVLGGTISLGTWQATPITDAYVASAVTWNGKLAAVSVDTTLTGTGTVASPLSVGYGTTSTTAARGDDSRLSDARAPSSVPHDTTLTGTGTVALPLSVGYGTTSTTAARGDDSRLSDARAPTASSTNYVQNGTSSQTASFNVSGTGGVGGALTVGGNVASNGQIRSVTSGGAVYANADTSIDWNRGNVQTTTASCGAFTFSNMVEGGAYTLVVTGGTSTTCSFSQTVPDTLSAFKFQPANGVTTAATSTVFTFLRAGNVIYVSWIPGF